jgi:hypothetical protein
VLNPLGHENKRPRSCLESPVAHLESERAFQDIERLVHRSVQVQRRAWGARCSDPLYQGVRPVGLFVDEDHLVTGEATSKRDGLSLTWPEYISRMIIGGHD